MFGIDKGLAIGIMIGGVIFLAYFTYSQYRISSLVEDKVAAEISVASKDLTIKQYEDDLKKVQDYNKEVADLKDRFQKESIIVDEGLSRLHEIVKANNEVGVRILNETSDERLRCIEIASGATLNKNEKNTQCPNLM